MNNKYYIRRQNNLTIIIKSSICEMNENIKQLSLAYDELNIAYKKLYEENDKLKEQISYLKYDNKCLNEEIERRNNENN